MKNNLFLNIRTSVSSIPCSLKDLSLLTQFTGGREGDKREGGRGERGREREGRERGERGEKGRERERERERERDSTCVVFFDHIR